jgi:hypothetical protein
MKNNKNQFMRLDNLLSNALVRGGTNDELLVICEAMTLHLKGEYYNLSMIEKLENKYTPQ